jgi:hypothetical protein
MSPSCKIIFLTADVRELRRPQRLFGQPYQALKDPTEWQQHLHGMSLSYPFLQVLMIEQLIPGGEGPVVAAS